MIKSSLVLKIKKPDLKYISTNNLDLAKKSGRIVFLDLSNFAQEFAQDFTLLTSLLLSTALIILFSLTNIRSPIKNSTLMVLNIEVSGQLFNKNFG